MINYYELLYIIPATEDTVALKARVEDILRGAEMEVVRHEEAGRFRIAYPMKRVRQGIYYLAAFRGDSIKVPVVEATLRLEGSLLRAVISRSSEAALARRLNLAAFENPVLEGERRRPTLRRVMRRAVPVVATAAPASSMVAASGPAPAVSQPAAKPMSEDEINKEIDKILEEKIL